MAARLAGAANADACDRASHQWFVRAVPRQYRGVPPRLGKDRIYRWVGSSRKDYREFPPKVQDNFGFELFLAQTGQHPPSAKLLKGLGSGIVELVDDFDGDTFRAVYTVRFESAVYVLHSFKKKSKQGIKTPQSDIELIKRRLKDAEADYAERRKQERKR